MVVIKSLTENQALDCIKQGEFGKEVTASNGRVALVFTQSWCPQWASLQRMIEQLDEKNLDVWLFVYDQSNIFQKFMAFKENVFGNDQIPYVRYYIAGKHVGSSNYVARQAFLDQLKAPTRKK